MFHSCPDASQGAVTSSLVDSSTLSCSQGSVLDVIHPPRESFSALPSPSPDMHFKVSEKVRLKIKFLQGRSERSNVYEFYLLGL